MASNFPKHVPHKLHLVTLIGSGIRRPWWEKQTLKALGLTKRKKSVVLKNTPQNNEQLRKIKTLIDIKPITFVQNEPTVDDSPALKTVLNDLSTSSHSVEDLKLLTGPFLNSRGEFDLGKYQEYVDNFPAKDFQEVLDKNHKIGSETLNFDFDLEEEKQIKDKGRKVELYFLKKTAPKHRARLADRRINLSKY